MTGADVPDDAAARNGEDELDPRLHYANERTFLAWIRTALALITAGLVITQLLPAFKITGGRRIVGLPLIVLGTFLAIAAFRRWDTNERAMGGHRPLPPSRLPLIVAGGVAVVAVIALVIRGRVRIGGPVNDGPDVDEDVERTDLAWDRSVPPSASSALLLLKRLARTGSSASRSGAGDWPPDGLVGCGRGTRLRAR